MGRCKSETLKGKDPVPDGFDWDGWIGPAPFTDFIRAITTQVSGARGWIMEQELLVIWDVTYTTQLLKLSG